jgi:uncharacterized membrane protein
MLPEKLAQPKIPTQWKIFFITLIIFGVFFRFVNIESKAYWIDETFTSLQVSGYSQSEIKREIQDGHKIDINDIKRYQYPMPNSSKTPIDVMEGLISFEPQHTPLYFVSSRYWLQMFGNSITVIRSLSVFASIISLFVIYFICIELFNDQLTGYIATALFATSPFFVILAQEARPYSLWTTTILLSSLALLKAQGSQTIKTWFLYALSVTIGLYTFLFTALVILSHATYIFATEKFQFNKINKNIYSYIIASTTGILLFLPWIVILFSSKEKLQNYASLPAKFSDFLEKGMLKNFGLQFLDFGIKKENYFAPIIYVFFLVFLIFCIYVIYFIISNKQIKTNPRIFILSLFFTPTITVLLTDIVNGNQRFLVPRYLIPSFLGLQIAIAYFFAARLMSYSPKNRIWQIIISVVFSFMILSDISFVTATKWPTKEPSNLNFDVAKIINRSKSPLVLSDAFFIKVFSLSYALSPDVKYQLTVEPADPAWREFPEIENSNHNIFVYDPSDKLIQTLKNRGKVTPLLEANINKPILWQFNLHKNP